MSIQKIPFFKLILLGVTVSGVLFILNTVFSAYEIDTGFWLSGIVLPAGWLYVENQNDQRKRLLEKMEVVEGNISTLQRQLEESKDQVQIFSRLSEANQARLAVIGNQKQYEEALLILKGDMKDVGTNLQQIRGFLAKTSDFRARKESDVSEGF